MGGLLWLLHSRPLHEVNQKNLYYVSISQIKLNREFTYALKRLVSSDTLTLDLRSSLMSQLPLDQRHQVGEVWARLKQGKVDMLRTSLFHITLFWPSHLILKNLFNVIIHTLLESSVYVKYGPKILDGLSIFFEKSIVYTVRSDLDP